MAEIVIKLVNGELAGKTSQSISKELNAAALAAKKAEVGTQAWIDAHARLDKAKALQADLTKQIKSTAAASDLLKSAWNKLPGAQFFNQVADSFGLMKAGVGGLVNQFGILKVAIASTGIGLLVLALGSLVTWFAKTEEGADTLKKVLYPVQVIFQKVTGFVAELGGTLFKKLGDAIQHPKQALKDLGDFLMENLINRLNAGKVAMQGWEMIFKGEFKAGFKKLGDAIIQGTLGVKDGTDKITAAVSDLVTEISSAIDVGQELLKLENDIEDAEVELETARARLNVRISEGMELARSENKLLEDRIAAARSAIKAQDQIMGLEENILLLKLKRLKIEQDTDRILTDDERLERAKLEADIIQLQADNIDKKRKAAALLRSLEQKAIDDDLKHQIENEKSFQRVRDDADKKMLDGVAKTSNLMLDTWQVGYNKNIKDHQDALALKLKHQEEFHAAEKALQAGALDLANSIVGSKIDAIHRENEASERRLERIKEQHGEESTAYIVAQKQIDAERKRNAQRIKKAEKLALKINLAGELANIWKNANQFAFPYNLIVGGLQSAAALIRYRNNVKNIEAQEYAKGGIPDGVLRGRSHAQGGIPLVAEGDEIILTKGVYKNPRLRRMASEINVAGGGRRFAAGGPVNPFDNNRAPVAKSAAADVATSDASEMLSEIRALRNDVAKWPTTLKVVNVVSETEDGIKVINKIKDAAHI